VCVVVVCRISSFVLVFEHVEAGRRVVGSIVVVTVRFCVRRAV
jgi:hypothetical protein